MKTKLLLFVMSLLLTLNFKNTQAQTNVVINGGSNWLGYMNVFDLSNTWMGAPPSGVWGLSDVKTTINVAGNTVTLQPNFNTYNAADPYWSNGAIGNKIMEGNSYVESTSIPPGPLNFSGTVLSNTLSSAYTKNIFIKVLDPSNGWATILNQTMPIPASGYFSLSATIPPGAGLVVQYGFTITGLNANPAAEASLGSVIIGYAAPLPLDLISFTANAVKGNVILNWKTENEKNVEAFELERSYDGISFSSIESIPAKNELVNEYNTTDKPSNTTAYYRLKMMDMDGKTSYSSIQKVSNVEIAKTVIVPNPTSDFISIQGAAKLGRATIYDMQGRNVYSIEIKNANTKIDVSSFVNGMYLVQFKNGTTLSFVKQ